MAMTGAQKAAIGILIAALLIGALFLILWKEDIVCAKDKHCKTGLCHDGLCRKCSDKLKCADGYSCGSDGSCTKDLTLELQLLPKPSAHSASGLEHYHGCACGCAKDGCDDTMLRDANYYDLAYSC